jgi:hypothetical protein
VVALNRICVKEWALFLAHCELANSSRRRFHTSTVSVEQQLGGEPASAFLFIAASG